MKNESKRRDRPANGEMVHQFLCRLPNSLNEKLRERAFLENRPKAEIIREALTIYLR